MKTKRHVKYLVAAVAALTVTGLVAMPSSGRRHGTDILHLFLRTAMVNEGVEADAAGQVDAKRNRQGNADNQKLEIRLNGLGTNATYQLLALLGDDTNLTLITDFTTDDEGEAKFKYQSNAKVKAKKKGNGRGNSNGQGNGNGGGHGRGNGRGGHDTLPAALNPISNISTLTVFNTSTQAVLTADLTAPDKFQYLVKRNLSTNDVDAVLRIKATADESQFRLTAKGLSPTNDYFLILNGGIVQTNSTDENGKLVISSLLADPGEILQLHSVALSDTAANVILSTELP